MNSVKYKDYLAFDKTMKKSKIADKIDECFDDYGLENMDVMINFIKMLQDGSLALTKLILENCKNDNFKKEDILTIFEEATATVANSIKNSSKNIVSGGCEVCGD